MVSKWTKEITVLIVIFYSMIAMIAVVGWLMGVAVTVLGTEVVAAIGVVYFSIATLIILRY